MGAVFRLTAVKPLSLPYKVVPDKFGSHTYSARLNVQIALLGPSSPRTKRFEAIIDSGATRCLFDADLADFLGVDLPACPIEVTVGISGIEHTYLCDVLLYVPGGPVMVKAGFKRDLPVVGLLGMNGFFEHFKVTFDPAARCCVLERLHRA